MKLLKIATAFFLTLSMAGAAQAARIALVDPYGNDYDNALAAANNLSPGSTVTIVSSAAMNAASAASLHANYDTVIFSWLGEPYSAGYWSTLVSYANMGGGIIFDGAANATSAMAGSGVTFFGPSNYSGGTQNVTNHTFISGPTVQGDNHHLAGLSGNADWTTFLEFDSTQLGLFANFGAGHVIVTSTDFFYHGDSAEDLAYLTEELNFALNGADVPEPASMALLSLGLIGLAASRRKAAKNAA